MSDKVKKLKQHSRILDILDRGIDAGDYERILGMESLTGGEYLINTEMTEKQAMILSIIDAINDPRNDDGTIDDVVAYDCPVLRTFVNTFKKNMISKDRQGRRELVKVLRGEEDSDSVTGRIKDAILGND